MHPGARIPAMPVRRPSLPSLLPCGSRAGGNRPQGVRLHADRSKRVTAIIGSRAGCERRHQCLGPPMGASEVERAQVRREIGAIARSDRKRGVEGKSWSVRVDLGGRSILNKKTKKYMTPMLEHTSRH